MRHQGIKTLLTRITIAITLIIICSPIIGATDYAQLKLKADRFYAQQEWASASAMYGLMIDRRPHVAQNYGKAIVALTMQDAPVSQRIAIMSRSMDARVPLDSVFSVVERNAYDLGNAAIYERFLLDVRDAYPWMKRSVNSYLLRYYTYRADGPMMIEYSRIMLDGMPHNPRFLESLARGYLLDGKNDEAMTTYRTILEYYPDNYNALLSLGNYYYIIARDDRSDIESRDLAARYLSAADKMRPTPYVTALLASPVLSPDR